MQQEDKSMSENSRKGLNISICPPLTFKYSLWMHYVQSFFVLNC